MAGTQAQRPTISPHEGTSATRFRTNRTTAQHSQTTVITTTQSGPNSQLQSQQYANTIGCSSNSGNGSTIAISTITTAPHPSRVSEKKMPIAFHDCTKWISLAFHKIFPISNRKKGRSIATLFSSVEYLRNSLRFALCFSLFFANTKIFALQQLLESSQMLQQPQHVEIVLNDDNDDAEQIAAEKEAAEHTTKRVRHRRHKRPFYRRVFNYIRSAWTGVTQSSNGKFLTNIFFFAFLPLFHNCQRII